ncbi:MAG TPA: hypothetical protein PKA50_12280, partial [Gemmatimonadales bacterium]|nr:hypothetical protein [Gemmatimonadales bacterium]
MKLLFATRSAGKKREIRRILEAAGHEVVFPDDVGVPERPIEDNLGNGLCIEPNTTSLTMIGTWFEANHGTNL